MTILLARESTIDQILATELPVVMKASATWCGPCRTFAPAFEQVSKDLQDKAVFATFDADESAELAAKYGVRGLPTVLILRNGELVKTISGAMTVSQFKTKLEEIL